MSSEVDKLVFGPGESPGRVYYDGLLHQWIIEAAISGPAGSGAREAMPGVTIVGDIARPERYCRIEIDAASPDLALGEPIIRFVGRMAGARAADLLIARAAGMFRTGEVPDQRSGRMPGDAARMLRSSVLTGLAASDPDEPLWELEAFFTGLQGGLTYESFDDAELVDLARRLLDASSEGFLPTHQRVVRRAVEWVEALAERVARVDEQLAGELTARGIDVFRRRDASGPAASAPLVATQAVPSRSPELAAWAEWSADTSSVTVTVPLHARKQWACVFDGSDLVAIGPMVDGYDVSVGYLGVPPLPSRSKASLVLTDRPATEVVSTSLRDYLASTESGRAAARLDRLGDHLGAAEAWERCAVRWDDAGDALRAALARTYAREAFEAAHSSADLPRQPVAAPFLVDLLRRPS